ncbi:ROK family transcriptional regulator [Oceanotoga sp. DSM 15011]|uniref:ROK family transcriptional regulator n=1 Tax=Oceanotoga sp. DSM 15011 TaxID=2984951 RepID=UPI0021F4F9D1|nr:ROK family transcriptional regulator [Oceanotoga sp. DSM 15011]UYO98925.1 ROK family transcriptional regulator [Oceanotoga sp. DSM 15011]
MISNQTQLNILENLWINGYSTVPELSRNLKIDRSNISRNASYLYKKNYIIKTDKKENNNLIGRKADIIRFNYGYKYTLGIYITESFILSCLMDLGLNIISENIKFINLRNEDTKKIIQEILISTNKYTQYFKDLMSVSVAFPEATDSDTGTLIGNGLFQFENFPLKEKLEKETGLYFHIENDANAGAMYYLLDSKLKYKNLVFMLMGFFFHEDMIKGYQGNGIIINKKIYKGSNNLSGEQSITTNLISNNQKIRYENFTDYLKSIKNPEIIFDDYLEKISTIISTTANILDPDVFVLGGYVHMLPNNIINLIKNKTYEKIINYPNRKFKIVIDDTKLKSIVIGASGSFMNKLMKSFDFAKNFL